MPSSALPYLPPRGSDRGGAQNGAAGQVQDRDRSGCAPLSSAAASEELCARQTEGRSSSELIPARLVPSAYGVANSEGPPLLPVCYGAQHGASYVGGTVGYGAEHCAARESSGLTTHGALSRKPVARSVYLASSACGLANSAGMSSASPLRFVHDYANTGGNAGFGATRCATSGSVGLSTHVTLPPNLLGDGPLLSDVPGRMAAHKTWPAACSAGPSTATDQRSRQCGGTFSRTMNGTTQGSMKTVYYNQHHGPVVTTFQEGTTFFHELGATRVGGAAQSAGRDVVPAGVLQRPAGLSSEEQSASAKAKRAEIFGGDSVWPLTTSPPLTQTGSLGATRVGARAPYTDGVEAPSGGQQREEGGVAADATVRLSAMAPLWRHHRPKSRALTRGRRALRTTHSRQMRRGRQHTW